MEKINQQLFRTFRQYATFYLIAQNTFKGIITTQKDIVENYSKENYEDAMNGTIRKTFMTTARLFGKILKRLTLILISTKSLLQIISRINLQRLKKKLLDLQRNILVAQLGNSRGTGIS